MVSIRKPYHKIIVHIKFFIDMHMTLTSEEDQQVKITAEQKIPF